MSAARSPFDLAGPTALATGGNQGLGRAFASGPLRRAPGSPLRAEAKNATRR